MLVPLIERNRRGIGQLEWTFTPGPARLTSPPAGLIPRFENVAMAKFESTAATAAIVEALAGLETGLIIDGRELSFPAAATINVPACKARRPAIS